MAEVEEGDRLQGFGAWKEDLYGTSDKLTNKRLLRGWDPDAFTKRVLQKLPNAQVADSASSLLFWNATGAEGRRKLYSAIAPWE